MTDESTARTSCPPPNRPKPRPIPADMPPGHADLMVPPETLDAYIEANPPPSEEIDNLHIALELIPPGPGWRWTLCCDCLPGEDLKRYRASVTCQRKTVFIDYAAVGASPAQAMTAAALRARAEWLELNREVSNAG